MPISATIDDVKNSQAGATYKANNNAAALKVANFAFRAGINAHCVKQAGVYSGVEFVFRPGLIEVQGEDKLNGIFNLIQLQAKFGLSLASFVGENNISKIKEIDVD